MPLTGRLPDLPGGRLAAIRLADLACPVRRSLRAEDRAALTSAGTGRIRSGDLVVFCKPVVIAPAVVRRDGHVQAGGHPADHARLGMLEQQLDEMTGQHDTIGQVAAQVKLAGKVKGTCRRSMTTALMLRAVLLMTLMPEAVQDQPVDAEGQQPGGGPGAEPAEQVTDGTAARGLG